LYGFFYGQYPKVCYDPFMAKTHFEWDENKNSENLKKHGVPFELAQYAFADPKRVVAEDLEHSQTEKHY